MRLELTSPGGGLQPISSLSTPLPHPPWVGSSTTKMLYFHPFLGISVCLAESWIIKDKHIFNVCVALLGLLLVVLGTFWSGAGLDKTSWAEGEKAVLEEGRGFNQSLVQAQGSQGCCLLPERGPKEVEKLCGSC